jgi:ubiquitin-conjugating enzyme E2 Q
MAEHLKSGKPLSGISAPKGALTVLRWVVGSCRAYLKEGRQGEGVVTDPKSPVASTHPAYHNVGLTADNIRQFSFVVGDPEQEENFAREIREAKVGKPSLKQYPTMLAFHGTS